MKAGTTQTICVDLGIPLEQVETVIFTFADRQKKTLLKKEYPGEVYEQDARLYIPLSQEDTLLICGDFQMEGQINFVGLSVAKTKIFRRHMAGTLATQIIDGNTPSGDDPEILDADISDGVVFVDSGGGPGYEIGAGLKLEGNVLSVDTATAVEEDNTKPVTSGAVYVQLGNVEALLENI